MDDCKEVVSSRVAEHVKHGDCDCIQKPHAVSGKTKSHLEKGDKHQVSPLAEQLLASDSC